MKKENTGLDMTSFYGIGKEKEKKEASNDSKKVKGSKKEPSDKKSSDHTAKDKTKQQVKKQIKNTESSKSITSEDYVRLIDKISPSEIEKMTILLDKTPQSDKVNSLIQVDDNTKKAFNTMKDTHRNRYKSGLVVRALEVYFSVIDLVDKYSEEESADVVSIVEKALKEKNK
ncbi:hypothetical protein P7D73_18140 [Enterococcus raffinosus]|uniref:hypothetical protein n=1 Tax=Enterococcus raffinosus TaxID=71452 RepID=UPI00288E23B8|nr:hypothetical protein [Enterococcus raffinosus]MDT2525127.1 hypothetical protein [Enterococcus raffinosus]MDT2592482.1 hypothetical protein [Enterococcus raffinosus]